MSIMKMGVWYLDRIKSRMLFVPSKRCVKVYGSGKCVRHLSGSGFSHKKKDDDDDHTEVIHNQGGRVDEDRVDKIVRSKPEMDKVIKKLSNLGIKRRNIVFDV